jgi:hypothetical protein
VVIVMLLILFLLLDLALIVVSVKQVKKNMHDSGRTLLQEIVHESQNVANERTRKRNNGWRYRSDMGGVQKVCLPDGEPLVVPEGTFEQKVYTYDGRPLKGTRKGSRFMLAIVPGYHTMTSVYTGTVWTSSCAVAYESCLIGHVGEGKNYDRLTELTKRYPYVLVHGKRYGTDKGGWPIVKILLPSKSWFDGALSGESRPDPPGNDSPET